VGLMRDSIIYLPLHNYKLVASLRHVCCWNNTRSNACLAYWVVV